MNRDEMTIRLQPRVMQPMARRPPCRAGAAGNIRPHPAAHSTYRTACRAVLLGMRLNINCPISPQRRTLLNMSVHPSGWQGLTGRMPSKALTPAAVRRTMKCAFPPCN
jgi:hypothetical protein